MNLQTVLNLLPKVGPIVAAAPEFKALFDQIIATFGEHDQDTLKEAYALATSHARDAHAELAALVKERG